jgi:hypothetical protein
MQLQVQIAATTMFELPFFQAATCCLVSLLWVHLDLACDVSCRVIVRVAGLLLGVGALLHVPPQCVYPQHVPPSRPDACG